MTPVIVHTHLGPHEPFAFYWALLANETRRVRSGSLPSGQAGEVILAERMWCDPVARFKTEDHFESRISAEFYFHPFEHEKVRASRSLPPLDEGFPFEALAEQFNEAARKKRLR